MERLEAKKINGHTYYYLSQWHWVDGRCRRVSQKYLGKLESFSQQLQGQPPKLAYAQVFSFALPCALWQQAQLANLSTTLDELCPKRSQGLSTGTYLALAALNRALDPVSKSALWDWFSQTSLLHHLPKASQASLAPQRFWDHMNLCDEKVLQSAWQKVIRNLIEVQSIDRSSVCFDGTNFYSFIDTFNVHCTLAKRGKNKQGRASLRQISYALFCSSRDQIPLFYEVYEGNRPDSVEFPQVLRRFHEFLQSLGLSDSSSKPRTILIFDKGNNSKDNFGLLDELGLGFVGSVKLDEHKDLAKVIQSDDRWQACEGLPGTKAFAVTREVYGKERTVVVTFNQNLYDAQWATVQADLARAVGKLKELQARLARRAQGEIKGGKTPTPASVVERCQEFCARPHLSRLLVCRASGDESTAMALSFEVDDQAVRDVQQTLLGKTLLITDQAHWSCEQIVRAYRSQFVIEDIFKGMKDRKSGSWWPLHHWTDQKIRVHGFYCTVAVLLRAMLWRRVRGSGVVKSLRELCEQLDRVKEVVNVYTNGSTQRVLTQTTKLQDRLLETLGLAYPLNLTASAAKNAPEKK